jgi:hypothetical protein
MDILQFKRNFIVYYSYTVGSTFSYNRSNRFKREVKPPVLSSSFLVRPQKSGPIEWDRYNSHYIFSGAETPISASALRMVICTPLIKANLAFVLSG